MKFSQFLSFFFERSVANISKEAECEVLKPRPKANSSPEYKGLGKELDDILFEGSKQLGLKSHRKDAILILGNRGSGKTTVSLTIYGDLETLHAKKTKSGNIVIIDDGEKINLPSTKSSTLIPEYNASSETHSAFYDWPGFDDSRGPAEEIAVLYFAKSVLDKVEHAKFLFTIPYNSVKGGDRNDFDLLAKNAAILVQDMSKFTKSIGLIVTKVPNVDQDGKEIKNDELISKFKEFFKSYVNFLRFKIRKVARIASKDFIRRLQRQLTFAEIVSAEDDYGNLKKLRIIKDPPKCGPFSEIPTQVRLRIRLTTFYSNLMYASVSSSDFEFALKDSNKVRLNELVLPTMRQFNNERSRQAVVYLNWLYFTHFNSSMNGNDDEIIRAVTALENHKIQVSSLLNGESFNQLTLSKKNSAVYHSVRNKMLPAYLKEVEKREEWINFFEKFIHLNISRKEDNTIYFNFLTQLTNNFEGAKKQITQIHLPRIISSFEIDVKNTLEYAGEMCIKSYVDQFRTFPNESYEGIKRGIEWMENYQLNTNASASQELERLLKYLTQNCSNVTAKDVRYMFALRQAEKYENVTMDYRKLAGLPRNSESLLKSGIKFVIQKFQSAIKILGSHLDDQGTPELGIPGWIETDPRNSLDLDDEDGTPTADLETSLESEEKGNLNYALDTGHSFNEVD